MAKKIEIYDNTKYEDYIKYDIEKVREFLRNDTDEDGQLNHLKKLAEIRGSDYNTYIDNGIFYIGGNLDDLYYIMEQLGYIDESDFEILDRIEDGEDLEFPEVARQWGIREKNSRLLFDRYIIPVLDMDNNLIKFVAYSPDKPDAKYINVDLLGEGDEIIYPNIKAYGLDSTKQGLEEGRIYIQEGMFDTLRFKEEGLPSISLMGSSITPFLEEYLNRFEKVYSVTDDDITGEKAYRKLKKMIPTAERIGIPVNNIKDSDEYGKQYKINNAYGYREWIEELKEKGNKLM